MRKLFTTSIATLLLVSLSLAQTPSQSPPPAQDPGPEDVVRISTALVQTDLVVTDKDGNVIPDLKIEEFKVYEKGKQQEVKFMEFVSADAGGGPRLEGQLVVAGKPVDPEVAKNVSPKDLRRVFAFVIDDLTVPFEDIVTVRQMLTNFVDTKMQTGDLVAIVRVVGGSGLLQQFTSDKAILRKAISQIKAQLHPLSAFNNLPPDQQVIANAKAASMASGGEEIQDQAFGPSNLNLDASVDGVNRGNRALLTLQVAGDVVTSLKSLPGRKNLVLISGGLPLQEAAPTETSNVAVQDDRPVVVMGARNSLGNVDLLLRRLLDKASRAGVVINAMNIRGLGASRGVSKFTDPGNEASSALMGGATRAHFGRGANPAELDNLSLDTLTGNLGLAALAASTGGISVTNTNNFEGGLDRVLARSSYYMLAYAPTEAFDNKYRKLEIKVTRPGAKVYSREGYVATADAPIGTQTKEQAIFRAVMSPLAKREVELGGRMQYRFVPEGAELDIQMLVNANNISFKQEADGRHHAAFDIVGFIANSAGKSAGGFSQTVTANLSEKDYQRSLITGLSYTAHAQLPPGNFQLRAVVRDVESGRLGSMSQYLEIPDIDKKGLTASSVFLYAIDVAQGANAKPEPLTALRELRRNSDLRYAVVVYNPKLDGAQTQLRTQTIVSKGSKIIFQEPESAVGGTPQNGQVIKIGQLGLGKAAAGRYVLTLVITDPLAKKEERTLMRSVDFLLVD